MSVYLMTSSETEPVYVEASSFGNAIDKWVEWAITGSDVPYEQARGWLETVSKVSDEPVIR